MIAGLVLLLFAVAGSSVLSLLHISLPAFRVAGGLLLFMQALTLTFSSSGLSSTDQKRDAEKPGDIAVFPLAFPLIAGPGNLATVVPVMGRTVGWIEGASVIAMVLACLFLTFGAMRAAEHLIAVLGSTGADVVGRVSGILAGLAVQFVFDGLGEAPFLRG
jgi:multiple antibiotic resistance protein